MKKSSDFVGRRLAPPTQEALVRFGPAIIVALFYITVVLHYAYTPDETYRYLQMAKNLAGGTVPAPDASLTGHEVASPMWALLIAGGAKAGLDPFVVAKTFDILFASLSLILVYTFSVTLLEDRLYALFAVLMVSLDAWFLEWSGSGLEVSFVVILVVLAAKYAYLGDYHIASFVAALLSLLLPEGFLLFLGVLVASILRPVGPGSGNRMLWPSIAVYLAVLVLWSVCSSAFFGSMVFVGNIAHDSTSWSILSSTKRVFGYVVLLLSTQTLTVLLLVIGIPFVIRKHGLKMFSFTGMLLVFVAASVLGFATLGLPVSSRYLVPLIPIIIVGALWILKILEITRQWSLRKTVITLSVLAFVSILQNQIIYRVNILPSMRASVQTFEDGIKPIALWLRSNAPENASVWTQEAATLGYIAERHTMDTAEPYNPSVHDSAEGRNYQPDGGLVPHNNARAPLFVIDQGPVKDRLASDSLKPVMSTVFDNPTTSHSDSTYYTLYKVVQ